MFVEQTGSLKKSSSSARWIPLNNTWFWGGGAGEGNNNNNNKATTKKEIFLSCRTYGMWSIQDSKLEKYHFRVLWIWWSLPTVKASNTVRILGISIASLSQHFSRQLSLKWHHRNNLMVIVLVPKLLSLQVKQHYMSWGFLSPSTTSIIWKWYYIFLVHSALQVLTIFLYL